MTLTTNFNNWREKITERAYHIRDIYNKHIEDLIGVDYVFEDYVEHDCELMLTFTYTDCDYHLDDYRYIKIPEDLFNSGTDDQLEDYFKEELSKVKTKEDCWIKINNAKVLFSDQDFVDAINKLDKPITKKNIEGIIKDLYGVETNEL